MNKKKFRKTICIILCMILMYLFLEIPVQAKSFSLPKKVYNRVKGSWWTENSSGGSNVKFTRQKIKYYNRKNNKVISVAKIKGCKIYKDGYLIMAQRGKYKYSYFMYKTKYKNSLEHYFGGWNKKAKYYSGSSSLSKGRWE